MALVRPEEPQPIGPDRVVRYPATILVAQVGQAMVREIAGVDHLYLTLLSAQVMEQLSAGNLGPYQLWQAFLPHGRRAEAADSTGLANSSIARIFPISPARKPPYRAQPEPKQAAYRVLLDVEL